MQRIAGLLALTLTAALLAGCVYDPYTGTYVPCCGYYGYPYYRYPYYRYPQPYAPYGYPSGAPQQGQPGAYPPPYGQPAPRPGAMNSPGGSVPSRRFGAATIPLAAQNFDAIDVDREDYIAQPETRAVPIQRRAERGLAGQSSVP
ncbi:MAG TPA: hypothetical protein VKI44_32065 [Acetobacteraceae bacterium]|nr:hypothetical protein [Acetobacteraceae bacterium]